MIFFIEIGLFTLTCLILIIVFTISFTKSDIKNNNDNDNNDNNNDNNDNNDNSFNNSFNNSDNLLPNKITIIMTTSVLSEKQDAFKFLTLSLASARSNKGLENCELIICCDGIKTKHASNIELCDNYKNYTDKIIEYSENNIYPFQNSRVIISQKNLLLVKNIAQAFKIINTEFVFLVQHDEDYLNLNMDFNLIIKYWRDDINILNTQRLSGLSWFKTTDKPINTEFGAIQKCKNISDGGLTGKTVYLYKNIILPTIKGLDVNKGNIHGPEEYINHLTANIFYVWLDGQRTHHNTRARDLNI